MRSCPVRIDYKQKIVFIISPAAVMIGKKIFVGKRDYEKFLEYISSAKAKYKFHVYAYCLMSNHDHLLLETSQANLSQVMHYINGAYTTRL